MKELPPVYPASEITTQERNLLSVVTGLSEKRIERGIYWQNRAKKEEIRMAIYTLASGIGDYIAFRHGAVIGAAFLTGPLTTGAATIVFDRFRRNSLRVRRGIQNLRRGN